MGYTGPTGLQRLLRTVSRAGRGALGQLPLQDARRLALFPIEALADPRRRDLNIARIRRLCVAVRVSDDTVLCRVLGQYKMYVEAADYGLAAHLMLDGFWEIWATEAMLALVRPGQVAVDVGANQGYYTVLLAGLVGPAGHVHAAEPNGRMVDLLRRSLVVNGLDGHVSLHAVPLGARSGDMVTLEVPEGMPSGAYLRAGGEPGRAMPTRTLDEIVGDGPVDFIKIDAEGSELPIWQGMARILARGAPLCVLMEFVAARVADPAAFLAEMRRHGFALSHVDYVHGLQPVTPEAILRAPVAQEWMLVLQRGAD